MRSRSFAALAGLLALAFLTAPFAAAGDYTLRSTFTADDGERLLSTLLKSGGIRDAADRKVASAGSLVFEVRVLEGEAFRYTYTGNITRGGGDPAISISMSRDVALGVLNADNGFRLLACAIKSGHASLASSSMIDGAALNVAKDRIVGSLSCSFEAGNRVTFRGLSGNAITHDASKGLFTVDLMENFTRRSDLGLLVVNQFGAPVGWTERSSARLAPGRFAGLSMFTVPRLQMDTCVSEVVVHYAAEMHRVTSSVELGPWGAGGPSAALLTRLSVASSAELQACAFLRGGSL
ncbi:MAG TPA: hypothetical protein VNZ52_14035 [Candidatus Thermoplasmatota archaeon]|nr:hypothetical protein [Candidatus Thermoplasmatota archaeon]